jgi:hypothetical protein
MQESSEVTFNAIEWEDLEVEQKQIGGLQPIGIPSDKIATTLVPGNAAFIESLRIAFY